MRQRHDCTWILSKRAVGRIGGVGFGGLLAPPRQANVNCATVRDPASSTCQRRHEKNGKRGVCSNPHDGLCIKSSRPLRQARSRVRVAVRDRARGRNRCHPRVKQVPSWARLGLGFNLSMSSSPRSPPVALSTGKQPREVKGRRSVNFGLPRRRTQNSSRLRQSEEKSSVSVGTSREGFLNVVDMRMDASWIRLQFVTNQRNGEGQLEGRGN